MGSGSSKQDSVPLKSKSVGDKINKHVKSIKFPPFSDQEVQSLKQKFNSLDENERGSIDLEQFKNIPEFRIHFFRERIFELVKQDMQLRDLQLLSFDNFIRQLTMFHQYALKEEKLRFMFRIYDIDNDGIINQDDLQKFYQLIYISQVNNILPYKKIPRIHQNSFITQESINRLAKDTLRNMDKYKQNIIDYERFSAIITDQDLELRMNIQF